MGCSSKPDYNTYLTDGEIRKCGWLEWGDYALVDSSSNREAPTKETFVGCIHAFSLKILNLLTTSTLSISLEKSDPMKGLASLKKSEESRHSQLVRMVLEGWKYQMTISSFEGRKLDVKRFAYLVPNQNTFEVRRVFYPSFNRQSYGKDEESVIRTTHGDWTDEHLYRGEFMQKLYNLYLLPKGDLLFEAQIQLSWEGIESFTFTDRSYVQIDDIDQIPKMDPFQIEDSAKKGPTGEGAAPSLTPASFKAEIERRNSHLLDLKGNYEAFVTAKVSGKEISEENIFSSLAKETHLIPSQDQTLAPLALPSTFINLITASFTHSSLIECLEIGTILPASYSFRYHPAEKPKIGKERSPYYQLVLHFSLLYRDEKRDPRRYCDVTILEVDADCVDVYKDLNCLESGLEISDAKLNEFLILGFYQSLKESSINGFPGMGTYRLKKGGLVAPKLYPFKGFYPLFEKFLGQKVVYDSKTYEGDEESHLKICGCDYLYDLKTCFVAMNEIAAKKIWLKERSEYKKYQQQYLLLLAALRLSSGFGEEALRDQMDGQLHFFSPDQIGQISSYICSEGSLQFRNLPGFISDLEDQKSQLSFSLEQYRQQLKKILEGGQSSLPIESNFVELSLLT
jgi:hypothetical protein